MKLYRLCNAIDDDSIMISSTSHEEISLISGAILPKSIELPFEYEIDRDLPGSAWPTCFLPDPVFLSEFVKILRELGVSNIVEYPVFIHGAEYSGLVGGQYKLLNIIGRVACADLIKSEYDRIGESAYEFDSLVIHSDKLGSENLFRLHESPTTIIVTERIAEPLMHSGFKDIFFESIPIS